MDSKSGVLIFFLLNYFSFVSASSIGHLRRGLAKIEETNYACFDVAKSDLNGCDYKTLLARVKEDLREDCPHDAMKELQIITGTTTDNKAKQYIDSMCNDAWEKVEKTSFEDVDPRFDEAFMNQYYDGDTFLNCKLRRLPTFLCTHALSANTF